MKLNVLIVLLGFTFFISAQNNEANADELFASGNYTKAITAYKSIKKSDAIYSKIAKSHTAIGNFEAAMASYQKGLDLNPNNTLLQYNYAKLLSRTKKFKDSEKLFKSLIKNDSLNPNYYYELGIVLEKQKDTLALENFKKAYYLDATHQKAIFKIAKRCIVKRTFKKAHIYIDKGLESYANNVALISLKAQAYYYQEYYTHAVVWFNKLIDLGENSEFIHSKLSLSYAQNSDYKDAIKHRKLALKYSPNNANAIYVIGTYYERLSDFKKAEDYITKALKLKDISLSNEYQKLAKVLNRQKKYGAAIKALQKSLKEDPTDMFTEFYLVRTKDEFYADIDVKIRLYDAFIKNHKDNTFSSYAKNRLSELKQQKFLALKPD